MAITDASRLADFGSGIGTEGAVLQVDNTNERIGIGTNNPQAMLQVGTGVSVYGNSGIVSATSFYGDGSNLEGITAGATLSAGSGAQRVVVTSLTSGTMTSAATDGDLSWNSSTNTLGVTSVSATNLTGALTGNVTGTATTATNLADGANITTGTINVARLGSGVDAAKFLRGDNTWQTVSSGGLGNIVEDTTPQLGGDLDGNSKSIYGVGIITATTFSGNLPTTDLTGTITNAQLAGSIANAKLSNDSVSFGGVSVDLGASDATPAFDLSDATNYPYTSLTGITTEIVGDTTPQLGGDLDGNSKSIYGVGIITATTFSGALTGDVTGTATTATNLADGANITTGTINVARLGSGVDAAKFLRGDNTWQTVSSGGLGNIVEDTTPQLGGDLDGNSKSIYGVGIITATTFSGDVTGTATTATNLADGANITTGTINVARLGSGVDAAKFLRGDNTWQTVSSGGLGMVLALGA